MRALVVLGASSDQVFLVRTARAMGVPVLAVDRNPASPGFREADAQAVVSTRDLEALVAWLEAWEARGNRVAGVTTMGSDIPHVVARLARHFGTPHVPVEAAERCVDKLAMKERLRERDVPVPWFAEVRSAAEVRARLEEHGTLVMKPIDRSGSRGVFLVDGSVAIDQLFERSRGLALSGRVMVEGWVPGLQISTESVLVGGEARTPGFADRNYELLERTRPRILENGGWVPSLLPPERRREVSELAERASLALGIETGVTKGDLVLGPDGPCVIEIAARLSGGDFCESLVPLGTGVNYVEAAVRLALGEPVDLDALEPRFERAVANRYLFPEPGRVVALEGVEEARALPGVEKLEPWCRPGDAIGPIDSHAERAGVFVVTGRDRDEVQERVDAVYATLRVRTEPC